MIIHIKRFRLGFLSLLLGDIFTWFGFIRLLFFQMKNETKNEIFLSVWLSENGFTKTQNVKVGS